MDKWRPRRRRRSRPKSQTSVVGEDSLLPPSLRRRNRLADERQPAAKPSNNNNNNSNRNASSKRRTINGFLKRVSAILEAQVSSSSSSASAEDLSAEKIGRKLEGQPKSHLARECQSMGDLLNANMELLEVRLQSSGNHRNGANCQSHSSDDSQDGPRRGTAARRGKVKARRVEQLRGDSSLDESGFELEPCSSARRAASAAAEQSAANKRSRASRTERYLKRMCNGGRSLPEASQDLELAKHTAIPDYASEHLQARLQHDITDDNFYARHTQVGVNPLVQQTLRCFCEFDRSGARPVPATAHAAHRPPTPPSRDHTSRVLLDKYQRMMARSSEPEPEPEAQPSPSPPPRFHASAYDQLQLSAISHPRQMLVPAHPPQSSFNATRTTPAEQHVEPTSTQRRSSQNLEEALCELEAIYNSLQLGDEDLLDRADRRTMEEFLYKGFTSSPDGYDGALIDPTASRNKSAWLADLTMDEKQQQQHDRLRDDMAYRRMHPKERPTSADAQSLSSISYLMTSPIPCTRRDAPPPPPPFTDPTRARRREPDVTLDDVVFRNMHYANNTLKVVEPQPPFGIPLGPITAAADSDYLHTNPGDSDRARSPNLPSRQPDLVTDDLAFRNLRKDTQQPSSRQSSPCFLAGTPSRSPLPLPLTTPRPVTRERRATSCRSSVDLYGSTSKPTSPMEPVEPMDSEDLLSVCTNSTTLGDYCGDAAPRHGQRFARRISQPEALPADWQRSSWRSLQAANAGYRDCRRRPHRRPTDRYSDADPSDRWWSSSSCADESSDESIRPVRFRRSPLGADDDNRRDREPAASPASVCGIPPPPPPPPPTRSLEPFTEHELSVYKQLCRDLENLVQLTQTSDNAPLQPSASDLVDEQSVCPILPEGGPAASCSSAAESTSKVCFEDVPEAATATESSPIKREISSILDSLKSLRESSRPEAAGTARSAVQRERVDESRLQAVHSEQGRSNILETIEDERGGGEGGDGRGKECSEDEEEEEKKDQVEDKLFLRNVQLAKLSGDWKESTPNRRRTSLASDDNRHWEGVNKCNHKYNSMPAKTSSLLVFRQYGSKRKSKNRKSICTIS